MRSILRITLLAIALSSAAGHAADLVSVGNWNESAPAHVVAGAGLQSTFESVPGATTLTISNTTGVWNVRIRRSAGGWNGDLKLFVKRSSAGSGSGTVSGGDAYVEVTTSDVQIFSGSADRSNVALQYKITGLSHAVPPNSYAASILFSVQ